MKRILSIIIALGLVGGSGAVAAQDVDSILGTWDVTFSRRGNEVKAMLSLAKNSDDSLVGLWTNPARETRTNLSAIKFVDGKLTFNRTLEVQDREISLDHEVTFDGDKVMGKIITPRGEMDFAGVKRAKLAPQRRGNRGGQNINLSQILKDADKDDDGKVSKDEAPDFLKGFFDRLDSDTDGFISKEEGEAAARAFGGGGQRGQRGARQSAPETEAEASAPTSGSSSESAQPAPAGRSGQGRGGDFFGRFDADKDGKISKAEAPERMQQFFEQLDGNGDGALDAEEIAAMRAQFGGRRPGNN